MRRSLLPAAPVEAESFTAEERDAYDRALLWLVVVPFTFPGWFRLRDARAEVAERLRWAMWFNVAQSVVLVAAIAAAAWAVVALPPLVARYAEALR